MPIGEFGDINAAPATIAQLTDTDGALGGITGNPFWTWVGKGLVVVGATGTGTLGVPRPEPSWAGYRARRPASAA